MHPEIHPLPLDYGLIHPTHITPVMPLIFNLLLGIPLFSKLINDDSRNDIRKQYLKEPPIHQIRHKLVLIPILIHTLPNNLLRIQRLYARDN